MIKFIIKLIIVIAIAKVFLLPYLQENWHKIEQDLPQPAQEMISQVQQHVEENPDGLASMLLGQKVAKVDEAKKQISLFEKRMKEMQEAADKAANGG